MKRVKQRRNENRNSVRCFVSETRCVKQLIPSKFVEQSVFSNRDMRLVRVISELERLITAIFREPRHSYPFFLSFFIAKSSLPRIVGNKWVNRNATDGFVQRCASTCIMRLIDRFFKKRFAVTALYVILIS